VAGTAERLDAIGAGAFSEFYPWSGKLTRTHNVPEFGLTVNAKLRLECNGSFVDVLAIGPA
jgi:hypothetical protein